MLKPFEIPDSFKLEYYERRYFSGTFEKIDLAMKFRPGFNGVGAVFASWIDAISAHDIAVKEVEEKLDAVDQLRTIYDKHNRAFRNWDAAWTSLNIHPEDYEEYLSLIHAMETYDERIKQITDPEAKAKAKLEHQRFEDLKELNARLHNVKTKLFTAKVLRDESRMKLNNAEKELNNAKEHEKKTAALISEDHIIANQKNVFISEIYPDIYEGYILSAINEEYDLEDLQYPTIMKVIKRAKIPCKALFRRYDYRLNITTSEWEPLDILRKKKLFIDDPRIPGDISSVEDFVTRGGDPNSTDYTGCSALHAAAANDRGDMVKLLKTLGANVNSRDNNNRNALYYAVCSGNKDIVRCILNLPAPLVTIQAQAQFSNENNRENNNENNSSNNSSRQSDVEGVVGRDVDRDIWTVNQTEETWGWTALHAVANRGDFDMIRLLLDGGASIYRTSKKGLTAEEVAVEANHPLVADVLRECRMEASAQRVYKQEATDAGITHILFLQHATSTATNSTTTKTSTVAVNINTASASKPNRQNKDHNTIIGSSSSSSSSSSKVTEEVEDEDDVDNGTYENRHDNNIVRKIITLDLLDDDKSDNSWLSFKKHCLEISQFITKSTEKNGAQVLVCDPTGCSSAPAAVCTFLLFNKHIRIIDAVDICTAARRGVKLSYSLQHGLENLEKMHHDRKLKRLRDRVRTSDSLSIAF
eukprot:gene2202-4283_t